MQQLKAPRPSRSGRKFLEMNGGEGGMKCEQFEWTTHKDKYLQEVDDSEDQRNEVTNEQVQNDNKGIVRTLRTWGSEKHSLNGQCQLRHG